MRLSRRDFLRISGGAVAVAGLGGAVFGARETGRVEFSDWRALPGMHLTLTLDMPSPELSRVRVVARSEGQERVIMTLDGARTLDIEMPYIETSEESFELVALAENDVARCISEPVEVLASPYQFGL